MQFTTRHHIRRPKVYLISNFRAWTDLLHVSHVSLCDPRLICPVRAVGLFEKSWGIWSPESIVSKGFFSFSLDKFAIRGVEVARYRVL
jgi:hypothetical protein